jgi:hypothetical protein
MLIKASQAWMNGSGQIRPNVKQRKLLAGSGSPKSFLTKFRIRLIFQEIENMSINWKFHQRLSELINLQRIDLSNLVLVVFCPV